MPDYAALLKSAQRFYADLYAVPLDDCRVELEEHELRVTITQRPSGYIKAISVDVRFEGVRHA